MINKFIKNMNIRIALTVVFISMNVLPGYSRICTTQYHCHDKNTNKTYKDGDVWNSVNYQQNACAECICMESKEYTVSCIELEVANYSDVKQTIKGNVRKQQFEVKDQVRKEQQRNSKEPKTVHVELELSEKEALEVRCQKGIMPIVESQKHVLLKQIHHFFMKRIMHCCEKLSFYRDVDPSCTVIFDELCNSQVVDRKYPDLPCNKPFQLTVT
ncbi:uncharacterized protein LOC120344267 [Styela clava]